MKKILLLLVLYSFAAVALTYPLATKLSSSTYGYSGDNFGAIHYFWWWKQSLLAGLPHRNSFLEEAPFGVTIDNESGAILYYLPVKLLTLLTDAVTGYNLVLLLSFPAAALAMFWLSFRLTHSKSASFIAGLIFAFSPYHFWKAYNHLDLALIWPLPLYALALWNLTKESLTRRMIIFKGSLAGLALAACILTNFYYGYFMLLLTGAVLLSCCVYGFWYRRKSYFPEILKQFLSLLIAGFLAFIISAPFMYKTLISFRSPGVISESLFKQEAFYRPFDNLISLSARPWDYLIPSQDHPLWGKYVLALYDWIKTKSNDFKTISAVPHERTIYLGWVSLILILLSVWLLWKNSSFREKYGQVFFVFGLSTLMLILISLPPFIIIKNTQINLPSFYLYKIFPMFRSYARLGVVVLMLVALLASTMIAKLLEVTSKKIHDKKATLKPVFFVVGFLSFSIILDFLNVPPAKVTDFSTVPPAYLWLAKQANPSIILEWPPTFNVADGLLMQRVHQKGMANWSVQSPYFGLWKYVSDLYLPETAKKLAGLGVNFVFVHTKPLFPQVNPVDDLFYTRSVTNPEKYRSVPPGMVLAYSSQDITVFSVEKKNAAKMATVVIKNTGYETRLLGETAWELNNDDNTFYFYLFGSSEALPVVLSWKSEDGGDLESYKAAFNAENVSAENGKVSLLLKPGENKLSVSRLSLCPECPPETLNSLSLQVIPK